MWLGHWSLHAVIWSPNLFKQATGSPGGWTKTLCTFAFCPSFTSQLIFRRIEIPHVLARAAHSAILLVTVN